MSNKFSLLSTLDDAVLEEPKNLVEKIVISNDPMGQTEQSKVCEAKSSERSEDNGSKLLKRSWVDVSDSESDSENNSDKNDGENPPSNNLQPSTVNISYTTKNRDNEAVKHTRTLKVVNEEYFKTLEKQVVWLQRSRRYREATTQANNLLETCYKSGNGFVYPVALIYLGHGNSLIRNHINTLNRRPFSIKCKQYNVVN